MATPTAAAGCAFGDFDNDGDIDILIVNLNEPPSLLRNDVTGKQHWLKVKLVGVKVEPQRDRRARDGPLRRQGAGAGGAQPVQLLFVQRFAAAFRARVRSKTATFEFTGRTACAKQFDRITANQLGNFGKEACEARLQAEGWIASRKIKATGPA